MERRLAAILAADIVGYSRLVEANEEATLRRLRDYREFIDKVIGEHQGRVFGSAGDSVIAEFASPVEAVRCAVGIQREIEQRNAELQADERMQYRIGINLGDVVVEGDDLLGDGINVAARLESLADAGGICISEGAYGQVKKTLDLGYEFLGKQKVKNIEERVPVYRVHMDAGAVPRISGAKRRQWQRAALATAAVVIMVVIAIAAWDLYLRPAPPPAEIASAETPALELPDKPSIAVLPFDNLSDDKSQDYFADGITEDIITDLSKISGLFVIARNSSFSYKGKAVTVRQMAEELGVTYVLSGSIRREADQVRINAQLVDAITGGHIWAERYSEVEDHVFSLQDRVISAIVDSLRVKLTDADVEELEHRPRPVNLAAYDWLLKGRKLLATQDKQQAAMAKTMFEKAIEADPAYARTYSNLGFYYWNQWRQWNRDKKNNLAKALELGQKAAQLDPMSATAAVLLAVTYQYQDDHEMADVWADRALTLGPTVAETLGNLGGYFRHANRYREAAEVLEKAIRLDPLHPPRWLSWLGHAYFMSDRPEDAVAVLKDAVVQNPGYPANHIYLAATYAELGELEKAVTHGKEVLRLNKRFTISAYERYVASNTKDPSREQRLTAALRKAGLPE